MNYSDEESKKIFWDNYSTLKTAEEKGVKKGLLKIARKMKDDRMSVDLIAKYTGLTVEEIESL